MTPIHNVVVHLEPVTDAEDVAIFLYDLLASREEHENISHRKMPTFQEHQRFVADRDHHYKGWFLILLPITQRPVGSIYLTHRGEIGIHLMPDWRRKGLGSAAVKELIKANGPGVYFANIAPGNYRSQEFFEHHGFRIVQHTYRYDWHPIEADDAPR